MEKFSSDTCRNCGSTKFKSWDELSEDDKFITKRLPDNSEVSDEQRKKQRFCKRCLYPIYAEFPKNPESI